MERLNLGNYLLCPAALLSNRHFPLRSAAPSRKAASQSSLARLRAARRRHGKVRRVDGLFEILIVVIVCESEAGSDTYSRLRLHECDGPALCPGRILRSVPRPQIGGFWVVRRRRRE